MKSYYFILLCTVILLFIGFSESTAQINIDSLLNEYSKVRGNKIIPESVIKDSSNIKKCGFSTVIPLFLQRHKMTEYQLKRYKEYTTRPVNQKSIVSQSGFFRIHFDTSGANVPSYDVVKLSEALDSAYLVEVTEFGFNPTPSDNGEGGDNKYDVYIENIGGYYGYTQPENEISPGSNKYSSYMSINCNFAGFYTTGLNAAKVTAAHEFHHAIQMGGYVLKESNGDYEDLFFYELTSTSMEEFVFDYINDYYGYMKSYFTNPDMALQNQSGYNLALWNIFLKKRFGKDLFVKQWNHFISKRALMAIELSLNSYNSSFYDEFKEFSTWLYFTNYRAISGKYFEEAQFFPVTLKPMVTSQFGYPSSLLKINAKPTSINYLRFINKNSGRNDTLAILITNSDIDKGTISPNLSLPFEYELSAKTGDGFYTIMDGFYYGKLSAQQLLYFSNREVVNDVLIDSINIIKKELDYVYPSPFKYSLHNSINISLKGNESGIADVFIYDVGMNCVFNQRTTIKNKFGLKTIEWNGFSNKNEKLGSGVYIYVVKTSLETIKGKLVIVNDK